jgi:hypothetical protein
MFFGRGNSCWWIIILLVLFCCFFQEPFAGGVGGCYGEKE